MSDDPVTRRAVGTPSSAAAKRDAADAAVLAGMLGRALEAPGGGWLEGVLARREDDRRAGDPESRRRVVAFDRACERAMMLAARAAAAEGIAPGAALFPWFSHWAPGYAGFVASVRAAGYAFRRMDGLGSGLPERAAFIRYDVHVRDIPPAFGFAFINAALGVEAEFHLPWRYSGDYVAAEPDLLLLARHLGPHGRAALHAAPVESHLIRTAFAGSELAFTQWTRTPEANAVVEALAADAASRFGTCEDLIAAGEAELMRLSAELRAAVPGVAHASGHGGAFNALLANNAATSPAHARLHDIFGSRRFITLDRARRAGLDGESHAVTEALGLAYLSDRGDGPPPTGDVAQAIAAGRSFVLVIHPALLQRGVYRLEPVTT